MKMKKLILASILSLAAFDVSAASNILSWTDNSSNEGGFVIQRKAESCTATSLQFTQVGTVAANIVTFTDSNVAEGQTYCYQVAAFNGTSVSAFSNTAGRTVPFSVPVAPSLLQVTGGQ